MKRFRDPKFLEGGFQLLDQGFFHLGLRIHHLADQAPAKATHAFAHHVAGVGDLNDQHSPQPGGATLSAKRFQHLFEIAQLTGWHESGKGHAGGATTAGHLHGLKRLAGTHLGSLVNPAGAFDGQGLGQAGIAQVEVPAGHLHVEAIGQGQFELLEV